MNCFDYRFTETPPAPINHDAMRLSWDLEVAVRQEDPEKINKLIRKAKAESLKDALRYFSKSEGYNINDLGRETFIELMKVASQESKDFVLSNISSQLKRRYEPVENANTMAASIHNSNLKKFPERYQVARSKDLKLIAMLRDAGAQGQMPRLDA